MKLKLNDNDYFYAPLMNKQILEGQIALTAKQWWQQMGEMMGSKLPQGLVELAQKLMMLPASTSGIERTFSTMGSIMTDVRNRIGLEKASQLCLIYRELNSSKK